MNFEKIRQTTIVPDKPKLPPTLNERAACLDADAAKLLQDTRAFHDAVIATQGSPDDVSAWKKSVYSIGTSVVITNQVLQEVNRHLQG